MKQEYKEKLDKMYWFFENYKNIPDEELHEKCMKDFYAPIGELTIAKNQEVLEYLIDFFEEEFDYSFEGVLEHLMSQISTNCVEEQKFEALCKKFDTFVKNDLVHCCIMISWFFYEEYFAKFREVFNKVKSECSEKFLDEIQKWIPDGADIYISILREDMKKW